MRVAIYARYSSDLQSSASIEDQVRICRERVAREGWTEVATYDDRAMSGSSHLRPQYQKLIEDARKGMFDVVLAESLDRVSRDLEHVAHLFKHLRFSYVRLITLSEGVISELHVGLTGAMSAIYLRQLAEKTHRGLRGRVEAGKSGGGLTYGYDVVRRPMTDGTVATGERKINAAEAAVVIRIFEAYAAGLPPRKIAIMLNTEGVPGPRDRGWGASTINGNATRGVGIINNSAYVGKLIWNKLTYQKDPRTGKRQSRLNDASAVIEKDVPELRIVSDDLWNRVKARQTEVMHTPAGAIKKPWDRRRPRYLLSGLAKCGCCGAGYVQISQTHLGCANARNKGLCSNRLAIDRVKLEATIIGALKTKLMAPDLFAAFCDEFVQEVNRARKSALGERESAAAELARIEPRLKKLVDAIAEGVPARTLAAELGKLEKRQEELQSRLAPSAEPKVFLNPNMAALYRERVAGLHKTLAAPDRCQESFDAIRSLVDRVVLAPVNGKLTFDLHGQIAAILRLSIGNLPSDPLSADTEQLVMVAGAGFEPTTFRL